MTMPFVYILHSGQLFGTERMALHTLQLLAPHMGRGIILAPPGPLHQHAAANGLHSQVFTSQLDLARQLWRLVHQTREVAVAATGLGQSLWVLLSQALSRSRVRHVHVVHGGTDEWLSYGRKRWLLPFAVHFVAVSEFVQQRLIAHGIPPARIHVVENSIDAHAVPVRSAFVQPGVRRVAILSRLDRIKRVDLLVQAMRSCEDLHQMQFDIYGSGELEQELRSAAQPWPGIRIHGFRPDAIQALRHADLLLHTCAEEPFGLVVLEAFAAGVPVLVPSAGGAASLVRPGVTGFHYAANDARALASMLRQLRNTSTDTLNTVAGNARQELAQRFAPNRHGERFMAALSAAL